MKSKLYVVLVSICVLIVSAIWIFQRHIDKIANLEKHRPIESKIVINNDQKKEMPKVDATHDLIPIIRYKDSSGIWQIAINEAPKIEGNHDFKVMGVLHANPVKGEVETPLYLCRFPQNSTSLDMNMHCQPGAKALQTSPVGYVSKLIRTGYFLAVRCRSSKYGMYVSLNAQCEDPSDIFNDFLGAIRASEISRIN